MNQRETGYSFEKDDITIDLTQLFRGLMKRAHLIILSGIVAALLTAVWMEWFVTPMYTSSTSMYMLTKSDGEPGLTTGDLQTGSQLTQDYMELVKSRSVLEEVIAKLGLEMLPEELEKMVKTENKLNTRILTISVENESPEAAKKIADELREVSAVQIKNIMDIDAVNTIEEANTPRKPSSPSVLRNLAFGSFVGILAAIAVCAGLFVADDTVKTRENIESYLNLNVLTMVPVREESKNHKKSRRKKPVAKWKKRRP